MTLVSLADLPAECFEGALAAVFATCSVDGIPNATWLLQVLRVDDGHIALCSQFARKTKTNLAENPIGVLLIADPRTAQQWRLLVRFARSEEHGATFDAMARRLAAVASLTHQEVGCALNSADVFEVLEVDPVEVELNPHEPLAPADRGKSREGPDVVAALSRLSESIAGAEQLEGLVENGLSILATYFGYDSVSLYLLDPIEGALYALASRGFPHTGIGARIPLGVGIIGTCAQHRLPIRIANMGHELRYERAVQEQLARSKGGEREIPLPALDQAASVLAVPLSLRGGLFGVLATERRELAAFDDRDVHLLTTAGQLLAQGVALHDDDEGKREASASPPLERPRGLLRLRYYEADDSVFINDEYLIKGLPGRILWLIVTLRENERRSTFQNRELRLHPVLRLPSYKDNLEARLLMLQRRLEEKGAGLRLRREERGRVRVECDLNIEIEVIRASDHDASSRSGLSGQAVAAHR